MVSMKITEKRLKQLLLPELFPEFSIGYVRRQICEAAEQIFGRPISFEERAFQALEVTTKDGNTPNAVHIWGQLARSLPSISEFYGSLGIPLPMDRFPGYPQALDPTFHDLDNLDWKRTLTAVFMRGQKLTGTGEHVASTGLVTVRDLAVSLFHSSRQSTIEPKDEDHLTNLAFRAIAREAGISDPKRWSSELAQFASKAEQSFDKFFAYDPSYGDQQFALHHDGKSIRFEPFGMSGIYQLQEQPLPDGSSWIARGNIVQPPTRFSRQAIGQLEELINGGAKEKEFQDFFERHPEFLLALGDYTNLHPQLILSEDDGGSLIPDFFLEKMDSGICDICDLKRPTAELVRYQRHRFRFRDAVMEWPGH